MAGNIRESKTILTAEDRTGGAFASMMGSVKAAQASVMSMQGALAGLAGGAVIGGFASMIKSSLDFAESVNKAAQKTGIAAEEFSQLAYAAKLADVSNEQLVKGFKGLSEMMVKASDATSLQAATMKALGVDISAGTGPALEKIADQFAKLPDGATKTALAVDLFGKAGMDMIPMLNQGGDGLRRMKEEADQLGLTIGTKVAQDAERFNDNLKALATGAQKTGTTLITHLAAHLADVTDAMKKAQIESGSLMAIWVGMGGVAAKLFTDDRLTEAEKYQKRINELTGELTQLRQRLVDSQDIMGPWGDKLRAGLIEAAKNGTLELAKLNKELADLYRREQAQADAAKAAEAAKKAEEKRIAKIKERFEAEKKAAEEIRKHNERAKKEDLKGWVEYAETVFRESDEMYKELARISDEYWKDEDKKKAEDIKGWVAYAEAVFKEADEHNLAMAKISEDYWKQQDRAMAESARGWEEFADMGARFFGDLALHGRSAFDRLRDSLKSFAAELVALFAKKWILNIAGNAIGGSLGGSLLSLGGAAGLGTGAGNVLNLLGNGASAIGLTGIGNFLGGATGALQGPTLTGAALGGGAAGMGSMLAAAGPYIAFAAAAAALYNAFKSKGGPKEGGGFAGLFSGAGALTSGSRGDWYGGVDTNSSGVQSLVNSTAQTLAQLISRFGGSSSGFGIQFGYDSDPKGTAPNRLRSGLTSASGALLYGANYDFARGDPSAQLQLEMSRLLVAGLRDSNIEEELKKLFNSFDLTSSTQQSIDELMKQAEDLNFVLHGLATNTIGGITLDAVRAAQQAGESLGQTFSRMVEEFQRVEAAVSQAIAGIWASAQSALGGQFGATFARNKLQGTYSRWQAMRGENFSFDEMLQHFQQFTPETLQQGIDITRQQFGVEGVALLQELWADYATYMQALGTSTQTVTSTFQDLAPIISNFGEELANARMGLAQYLQGSLVSNLSPLTPMAQYLEAKRQYEENFAQAQGGNLDAINRFGGLRDTFLGLSRSIYASSGQYNTDFFSTYNQGAGLTGGAVTPYTAQAAQQNTNQVVQALAGVVSALGDVLEVRDTEASAKLDDVKAMLMRIGGSSANTPLTNTAGNLA